MLPSSSSSRVMLAVLLLTAPLLTNAQQCNVTSVPCFDENEDQFCCDVQYEVCSGWMCVPIPGWVPPPPRAPTRGKFLWRYVTAVGPYGTSSPPTVTPSGVLLTPTYNSTAALNLSTGKQLWNVGNSSATPNSAIIASPFHPLHVFITTCNQYGQSCVLQCRMELTGTLIWNHNFDSIYNVGVGKYTVAVTGIPQTQSDNFTMQFLHPLSGRLLSSIAGVSPNWLSGPPALSTKLPPRAYCFGIIGSHPGNNLMAIDVLSGKIIWSVLPKAETIVITPILSDDESVVYIVSHSQPHVPNSWVSFFGAFDTASGKLRWAWPSITNFSGYEYIGHGHMLLPTQPLSMVDMNCGKYLWRAPSWTAGRVLTSFVGANGSIVIVRTPQNLTALDATTGAALWSRLNEKSLLGLVGPHLGTALLSYFNAAGNQTFVDAVDARSGTLLWTVAMPNDAIPGNVGSTAATAFIQQTNFIFGLGLK